VRTESGTRWAGRHTAGKGILGHREADAVLHTYVALNKPQDWITATLASPETAAAQVAAEFTGWAPELTALITDGETALARARSTPCRSATAGTASPE
jgi:hypothetical protein